jgi:N-acetylneuraminic acid mutarotase
MNSSKSILLATSCAASIALLAACGGGTKAAVATTTPQGPASGPSNSWTWASGAYVAGAWGSYGAIGTGTVSTAPGARNAPVAWRDSAGNLWLFGGLGYDSTGTGGSLNDLWEFSPSTSLWTWMGGSSSINPFGVYGAQGVAASTNVPGGREAALSWTDTAGNVWLFGGSGLGTSGSGGDLNDLWKYAPATGQWTWVAGSAVINAIGMYGVRGVPDSVSAPGAREASVTWTDSSGNLWLFGGTGFDSTGTAGSLNDLWEFNPSTNQWTWVSGAGTTNVSGQYGIAGVAAPTNAPGARFTAVSWSDASGNLWLFGGEGYDANGVNGALNDLWEFTPSTGLWTWVGGSAYVGGFGQYGTAGTAAASNVPGGREEPTAWTDSSGNFWLFGGLGIDSVGTNGNLDDLWMFNPGTGLWTFEKGSALANSVGVYGTLLSGATGNIPGSRFGAVGWIGASNSLWLFGGQGSDASGAISYLNDMWKYTP